MSSSLPLLRAARTIHLYLGVFIAPALIFFSITGGLQTFSLHETTRGSSYKPPAILVKLGQLHKKQTLVVPVRRPQPPAPATTATTEPEKGHHDHDGAAHGSGEASPNAKPADARPADAAPAKVKNLLPMKLFFLLVALGLFTSTVTGLYMSYKYIRNTKLITALLLAGIAIPALLTFL